MDYMTCTRLNKIFKEIKQEVELYGHENGIKWQRIKTRNFYISNTFRYNDHYIILLKSYETIVGFVDCTENIFYEFGKYSRTTSKQMTQIYNMLFSADYDRIFVPLEV